ncbi:hypothetical protein LIER_27627 [Lithospermum erythrorhizon]|uniref:Uncharacterized protein n=1 Tax=Lithospermum erythrorhizon TaxID=34254 RepID=A0AAV3RCP5_LITER
MFSLALARIVDESSLCSQSICLFFLPEEGLYPQARETDGLGFKPSDKDIKRIIAQLREERLARLEDIDQNTPGLGPIPHISATFPTYFTLN